MATFVEAIRSVLKKDCKTTEHESDARLQARQAECSARLLADSKKLSMIMPGFVISKD